MTRSIRTQLTAIALLAVASAAVAQGVPAQTGASACQQALIERFDLLPAEPLSDQELADVLYLREEEKLARDVYLTLSLSWELPLFDHIPRSEQQHMDLVVLLIDRYGLTDPVGDNDIGEFTDPGLQALYDQLVADGRVSLTDGLAVGALIEETDLADLRVLIATTDNADVALIAHNLAAGSRNHLRAFVGALANQGLEYVPQVIDPALFEQILTSPREVAVVYDELGDVLAQCTRRAGDGGGIVRRGPGQGGGRVGPGDGTGDGDGGPGPGEGGGDGNGDGGPGSGLGDGTGEGGGEHGPGTCDGTGPHGKGPAS